MKNAFFLFAISLTLSATAFAKKECGDELFDDILDHYNLPEPKPGKAEFSEVEYRRPQPGEKSTVIFRAKSEDRDIPGRGRGHVTLLKKKVQGGLLIMADEHLDGRKSGFYRKHIWKMKQENGKCFFSSYLLNNYGVDKILVQNAKREKIRGTNRYKRIPAKFKSVEFVQQAKGNHSCAIGDDPSSEIVPTGYLRKSRKSDTGIQLYRKIKRSESTKRTFRSVPRTVAAPYCALGLKYTDPAKAALDEAGEDNSDIDEKDDEKTVALPVDKAG